jgi:hypothetical protein
MARASTRVDRAAPPGEDHYRLEVASWRRPQLTGCSPWSVADRRSAYHKSRPTSSFRTWPSMRLRIRAVGRRRGFSSVVAPHLRDRSWSDRRHVVGPPRHPLSASGPLTCRLRRADQQDCPARSVKRRSGHREPNRPGRPHPCGLHQDRRGCLRDQGRRAGGAGPRLGGSLLRREMFWVFRRRPDRH